eukprot:UN24162
MFKLHIWLRLFFESALASNQKLLFEKKRFFLSRIHFSNDSECIKKSIVQKFSQILK